MSSLQLRSSYLPIVCPVPPRTLDCAVCGRAPFGEIWLTVQHGSVARTNPTLPRDHTHGYQGVAIK